MVYHSTYKEWYTVKHGAFPIWSLMWVFGILYIGLQWLLMLQKGFNRFWYFYLLFGFCCIYLRAVYRKAEDMNFHSVCLHVIADSIRRYALWVCVYTYFSLQKHVPFLITCIFHISIISWCTLIVSQCRLDIGILVFVPWVFFFIVVFFIANLPCLPLLFLISVSHITGLKMLKFYVWGWFLLLLLCLSYRSLKPLVASCFKWHHLAFHLQHWANAWDR